MFGDECIKTNQDFELKIFDRCIFSGDRPEGSKHNLKFQSAMWHHFKHFQSKDFFFLLPFFHIT
jgi:hypothetical protein